MRVLVTGGNRYIGLALVGELARRGHDVSVANSHEADLPEGVRRIHVDRRIPGALREALLPHRDGFDAVFDNTAYVLDDIDPMIELFSGRVAQYVFTSSTAVYRRSWAQPVTEDSRRHDPGDDDPRKAYGVGKVRCEDHLLGLHASTGFPATVLRVSHTLGPRSPLVTRDPIFFARLEQRRPVFVPGEGWPFLSLVHVADAASFMASVLGNDRAVGRAYNVTNPDFTSILGAVRMMADAVGVEPEIVTVPLDLARRQRPPIVHWGEGLVGGAVFSVERGMADLGWRPRFTIAEGYRDSYEWFAAGGRDRYEYDFSGDESILAALAAARS